MNLFQKLKAHIEPARAVVQNACVTFIEGAFVAWQVAGFQTDKIAIGAVIGGGVSAVYNLIVKPYLKHKGWMEA